MMRTNMKKRIVLMGLCAVLAFSGCRNKEYEEAFQTASATLEDGDYTSAEEQFQLLTERVGESEKSEDLKILAESYRGLGIAQLYQAKYAEASIALSKSLYYLEKENLEFEKDVKSYLAYSRAKRMEYDEAIDIYTELIDLYDEAEMYYLRGKCHIEKGEYDAAKADFDDAASRSTDSALFINIYKIYDERQMNADGSAYLEQGLELVDEGDYYNRGLIYYYLQEYGNAKDVLIEAVARDADADSMLLLGKVYLAMEDIASARAMYQEHVEDEQVAAEAYNGLALCDMEEGNYDGALAHIQKGLETADAEAMQSLLFNEICIYEQQSEWAMARQKVAEYLTMYPTDQEALREKQFLNH